MKFTLPRPLLIRLWYLPAFVALTTISFAILKVDFFPEITFRILFGFTGFLSETPLELPFDPKVAWVGGLIFISALVLLHWLVRRKNPSWSMGGSTALLLLPLFLLCGAWFVPHTLTQLFRVTFLPVKNWDKYEPGPRIGFALELLHQGVMGHAAEHDGAFPETLDRIDPGIHRRIAWGDPLFEGVTPREQFIYLGAGLGFDSDSTLPLLITAPFDWADRTVHGVITVGGDHHMIHPKDLDSWIARSLEAPRKPRVPEAQPEKKP